MPIVYTVHRNHSLRWWSVRQSRPVVAWLRSSLSGTHTRHQFLASTPFIKVILRTAFEEVRPYG